MRFHHLAAVLAMCLAGTAYSAEDHKGHAHDNKGGDHPHKSNPQHGGVVTVVKDVNYELVASAGELILYVTDHGKPTDLKGASAKLTMLTAGKKEEAILSPSKDALVSKGTYAVGPGSKIVALVSIPGHPAQTVQFSMK